MNPTTRSDFEPDDSQPPPGFGSVGGAAHVLIVAAGVGARAGGEFPKQYREIAGKPVLVHTVAAFLPLLGREITSIAVVVSANDGHAQGCLAAQTEAGQVKLLRCGGATRADSVLAGLKSLLNLLGAQPQDWVLVHDAARCVVHSDDILGLIDRCQPHPVGGLLAAPVSDTLKAEDASHPGEVARTLARDGKWLAQTPQMFRLTALIDALEAAQGDESAAITDEASAMEHAGASPLLVAPAHPNFKITYPQDFAVTEALLTAKMDRQPPQLRIGEGWDVHALVPGRPLVLGGVTVPFHSGLLGHSDADALLHAITDALLGAAGLGDIGGLFPDTDAAFEGADSQALLRTACERVSAMGWRVGNVDCTVIAQAPKLVDHKWAMVQNIARCLQIEPSAVNVKAKTAEKLGPVGLGQSIEARATMLLFK